MVHHTFRAPFLSIVSEITYYNLWQVLNDIIQHEARTFELQCKNARSECLKVRNSLCSFEFIREVGDFKMFKCR